MVRATCSICIWTWNIWPVRRPDNIRGKGDACRFGCRSNPGSTHPQSPTPNTPSTVFILPMVSVESAFQDARWEPSQNRERIRQYATGTFFRLPKIM